MAQHRKDHDPSTTPQAAPPPAARADAESNEQVPTHHRAKAIAPAPAAAVQPPPAASPPPSPDDERVEYRPSTTEHICLAGPVALGNWVGRVGNKFVRVYRGAQESTLPQPVIAAMAENGIEIGVITFEEMGLRQPPASTLLRGR